MPDRPKPPNLQGNLNDILQRLRTVERMVFHNVPDDVLKDYFRSYSWQSAFTLVPGFGHRIHADRDGKIQFVRAERSAGDGTSAASFDVLLNGQTLFHEGSYPHVAAGERLGPERHPDRLHNFKKGDDFQVNVLGTGGGSGPLRVTIYFSGEVTGPTE